MLGLKLNHVSKRGQWQQAKTCPSNDHGDQCDFVSPDFHELWSYISLPIWHQAIICTNAALLKSETRDYILKKFE